MLAQDEKPKVSRSQKTETEAEKASDISFGVKMDAELAARFEAYREHLLRKNGYKPTKTDVVERALEELLKREGFPSLDTHGE